MTPEQQRIKIAEACGWTCCGQVEGCQPHGLHPMFKVDDYRLDQIMNMEVPICDLPDYLNDLNAMHEAEKFLNHEQDLDYSESLEVVVQGKFNCNNGEDMRRLRSATASQRAEAFLKTLNLWEQ